MAQHFTVHPDNPQIRLLKQAVTLLNGGGIVAVPGHIDMTHGAGGRAAAQQPAGKGCWIDIADATPPTSCADCARWTPNITSRCCAAT